MWCNYKAKKHWQRNCSDYSPRSCCTPTPWTTHWFISALALVVAVPLGDRQPAELVLLADLRQPDEREAATQREAAREAGVKKDDIDSAGVTVRPEFEWRDGQRIYQGQTVQRDVNLVLRELDRYGALLQALARLDITRMGSPRLTHSDQTELELRALEQALANGTTKASGVGTCIICSSRLWASNVERLVKTVPDEIFMWSETFKAQLHYREIKSDPADICATFADCVGARVGGRGSCCTCLHQICAVFTG